jgi:hypothetical protein
MKVIQHGREQKGWAKEFTCTGKGNGDGGCGAVLLVEADDIFRTKHECYDGSTDHYTTFRCCECGVETDIDVPGVVMDAAPYKKEWLERRGIGG